MLRESRLQKMRAFILKILLAITFFIFAILVLYNKLLKQKDFVCMYSALSLACIVASCVAHGKVSILSAMSIVLSWMTYGFEYFDASMASVYAQACLIMIAFLFLCENI